MLAGMLNRLLAHFEDEGASLDALPDASNLGERAAPSAAAAAQGADAELALQVVLGDRSSPSGGKSGWRASGQAQGRTAAAALAPYDFCLKQTPFGAQAKLLGSHLASKGFCLLRGRLEACVDRRAAQGAFQLQEKGFFSQPPAEVLGGLLGAQGSCWQCALREEFQDDALATITQQLMDLGEEAAVFWEHAFDQRLAASCSVAAYLSRHPRDPTNPPLEELELAEQYMHTFYMTRLRLIYYAGPALATLTVCPVDDPSQVFRARVEPGTVLALRADACACTLAPQGGQTSLSVEANFCDAHYSRQRAAKRHQATLPSDLERWVQERLEAIVANDVMEGVPDNWIKDARQNFFKTKACQVLQLTHDLPTLSNEGWRCPFEGAALGGSDSIVEIPASRWDVDEYYDGDPAQVDNYKIYVRHMGMLDSDLLGLGAFKAGDFGGPSNLVEGEDAHPDQRHRLLSASMTRCLTLRGLQRKDTFNSSIGIFCGFSSSEAYYDLHARVLKPSQLSELSTAAKLSRLGYLLGTKGPSLVVDTGESSSASAADTAVAYVREGRCDRALACGASLILHPFFFIVPCATSSLSSSGRGRPFDESCDGKASSEAVVTVLLDRAWTRRKGTSPSSEAGAPEPPDAEEPVERRLGLIMGSALNSKGAGASLVAPSGPALRDVVAQALREAQCPGSILDGVEASAGGSAIADAVELGALNRALSSDWPHALTAALCAVKCSLGEAGPPSGLVSFARACLALDAAVHGPAIHLRQLSMVADSSAGGEEDEVEGGRAAGRLLLPIEAVEAFGSHQLLGVSSFGSNGTNVHQVLYGYCGRLRKEEGEARPTSAPIHWFPANVQAGKAEPAGPELDLYIVGTWSAWEKACKMLPQEPGVYAYTVTLGENCFEAFQFWLDGDPDQVLHPSTPKADQLSEVAGPSPRGVAGRFYAWCLDGRPMRRRMVSERQVELLRQQGVDPSTLDPPAQLLWKGDRRPPGYESAQGYLEMPIEDLNVLRGVPGDRYTVRLHLRAQYRRVSWEKLAPATRSIQVPEVWSHRYYVAGDFNYWTFSPMEPADGEPGLHTVEVQLLQDGGRLQVVRDRDWDQTFSPLDSAASETSGLVAGPGGEAGGRSWQLRGQGGDVFSVSFRRAVGSDDANANSISWAFVRNAPLDLEALAKDHRYYVVGSWTGFLEMQEMKRVPELGGFALEIALGPEGRESFQILLNESWLAAVHPNMNHLSFLDDLHEVVGPSDEGCCLHWLVGGRADEGLRPHDQVRLVLEVVAGVPSAVRWTRVEAQDEAAAPEPQGMLEG